MKTNLSLLLLFTTISLSCSKTKEGSPVNNHPPTAKLSAILIQVNPFAFDFTVEASDREADPLTFTWDFGEGTTRQGKGSETFVYPADKAFVIKVKVTDGKSGPVEAMAIIDTKVTTVTIDDRKQYQVMEGFGGFGARDVYWGNGPFTSPEFVNSLVNDLGITILRDEIPTNFEFANDNDDPSVTDLSRYNLNANLDGNTQPLGVRLPYFRALKDAGVEKFIVTAWSPPGWMKYNGKLNNGTNQNSAPAYSTNPDATTNQLKTDRYEEFAEMCVAFVKIFKREVGIDLYALSIQNEPRFSQSYQSCVYNGAAMRDLLKAVGKRFKAEGLTTRLFLPEDVGWLQGVESMVKPTLDDPAARPYADIVAVHGYDLDGITAASTSAQTWQTMYNWGAPYGKPLWMTETSGYANTYDGAMALAKAMFTALRYGQVSAWVFWTLSTGTLDEYSLMSSSGTKSKRYYASKNFYRYIRPGAQRIEATAPEESKILPLAFRHPAQQASTLVLINDNKESGKAIRLSGSNLPATYTRYVTSASDDCKEDGPVNSVDIILLPANSIVTLYDQH